MSKCHVLLVDDEEEFTRVVAERLVGRGVRVDVANGGKDAISMAQSTTYDLVILDLVMPGMDGIETLKQLLSDNRDLQVILLTGQATVQKSVDAMKRGAVDLLEKPVEIEILLKKIESAGERRALLMDQQVKRRIDDILRDKGW